MNSYNTYKNINKYTINSFSPSYISKLMNYRKNNGNPSEINRDISLIFHNNRNARALRPQKINLHNDINRKILENIDSTNDIGIKNNNYFSSLSSNSTSYNYYTKRRSQLYRNANNLDSSVSQSRNINKNNGNSLSKTTWSSFSIKETSYNNNNNNNNNKLTNGYEYKYNNMTANKKSSRIKNLKNRNNYYNGYRAYNYNEYNYDKLKENGIEYCIDKDGNPMTVSEIKTKNKYPIAYIIQKNGNNILLDLDNRIINPNQNGDYILPQRPYFIIRKYDVQYPELRVINYDNSNTEYYKINNNSDYISINVNDSNEKLYNNNNNNKKNLEKKKLRKNQKCNLYNFSNLKDERNNFFTKIDINNRNIQNKTSNFNSRKNLAINNDYSKSAKLNHSNIRDKKRKYIFVNKLANENKNIQLKIDIDNNDNNNNNNDNNSYFCTQLTSLNNTCKNKETDNKNLYSENNSTNNNTNKKDEKNEKNFLSEKRNNFKLFIKKLNGFKNRTNKLKDIKCFTHKEIKNLEFKFERKYKNKNITSFIRPSFMPSDLKIDTINETPKIKSREKEEEKNNKNSEKKEKFEKVDLKNIKKQKYSCPLNELMYSNNVEKQNNFSTPNNMLTTLSTLNHSFLSPPSEATAYTTIQNLHRELEKNKRFTLTQTQEANGINVKKFNSFKYYLKPRLNSQKVFHKRKIPDEINKIEKKNFSLFKLVNENENNTFNSISLNKFNNTALDFTIKDCQHNSDNNNNQNKEKIGNNIMNNSVCKCPYCHHLFYNQ